MGILAVYAVPSVFQYLEDAKYARAVRDVDSFFKSATYHKAKSGDFPFSWEDLGYSNPPRDPWSNEYILNNHDNTDAGHWRKDGPVVPINSYIDIFSPGPNGDWDPNIISTPSKDDVIIANDGQYIGKASDF